MHTLLQIRSKPTSNREDVEFLRLFHLSIQLSAALVGPVLHSGPHPLGGVILPTNGHVTATLVQRDLDFWVGDHTGDDALLTGPRHHTMSTLCEPHFRVCGAKQKHFC